MLSYADVYVSLAQSVAAGFRIRMLTYAGVCWRMLSYADVCCRMLTYADMYVSLAQSVAAGFRNVKNETRLQARLLYIYTHMERAGGRKHARERESRLPQCQVARAIRMPT
jgi:hypothetical protein